MTKHRTKTARLLNQLYRNCLAGEVAYRVAFTETEDSDLRYLFSSYSLQRAKLARELGAALAVLGIEGEEEARDEVDDESSEGPARSSQVLLGECARREEAAIDLYHAALEAGLPETLRVLITRQLNEIEVTRQRLEQLHNLARPLL